MGKKMVTIVRQCKIEGCTNKYYGKGLCAHHYQQEYRKTEKSKATRLAYYKKNKEKLDKKAKEWMANHPERIRAIRKEAYERYKIKHGLGKCKKAE